MESQEKLVIKINELPARAEKLSPDEVVTVFGGCREIGEPCACSPCCEGTCMSSPNTESRCM